MFAALFTIEDLGNWPDVQIAIFMSIQQYPSVSGISAPSKLHFNTYPIDNFCIKEVVIV